MRSVESMSRGSMSRNALPAAAGFLLPFVIAALAPVPARADIVRTATSVTFSGAATGIAGPVSASATLWIDGGFLNLLLHNTSPAATAAQGDLLTSFYFGISSGTTSGTAPPLTYESGSGQVYRYRAAPLSDTSGVWTPPATAGSSGTFTPMPVGHLSNLVATKKGDDTWQFRSGLSLVTSEPPLNFGIGTVGNSRFTSGGNNFQGPIVGKTDFGIASAAAEPSGTVDKATYYVSDSVLFRFGAIGDSTIDQISNHAVFGFGSDPDFTIGVPEPAGIALATIGGIASLGLRVRRRRGLPVGAEAST